MDEYATPRKQPARASKGTTTAAQSSPSSRMAPSTTKKKPRGTPSNAEPKQRPISPRPTVSDVDSENSSPLSDLNESPVENSYQGEGKQGTRTPEPLRLTLRLNVMADSMMPFPSVTHIERREARRALEEEMDVAWEQTEMIQTLRDSGRGDEAVRMVEGAAALICLKKELRGFEWVGRP